DGDRITLQMVRIPQLPFSAALIGYLEASMTSDAEKNAFVTPIRLSDTVDEYIAALVPDMANRQACGRHPAVREWVSASRTDGFTKLMREVAPDDHEKQAVLERLRRAARAAAENMPRLLATLNLG